MAAGWVGVGIAAVGAISSLIGGSKASSAARKQAKKEAALEGIVTTEKLRKLHIERDTIRGRTIAQAASGGVDVRSRSVLDILSEQAREFAYEIDVTGRVGASRASNIIGAGKAAGDRARYQGISNFFQFASQGAEAAGDIGG